MRGNIGAICLTVYILPLSILDTKVFSVLEKYSPAQKIKKNDDN